MQHRYRFLRMATTLMLGITLSACGGASPASSATQGNNDTTSSTAQQSEAVPEASSETTTQEPSSVNESLPSQLGSIAISRQDDSDNPVVSMETAREVFTIQLQGKTYELPCPVQDLLDDGWESMPFSGEDSSKGYMSGWSGIPLIYKGDKDQQITIDALNLSDQECGWRDSSFTGASVYASTGVPLESSAGFGLSVPFDEVLSVVGANANRYQSKYTQQAQVSIYTEGERSNNLTGTVSYECAPEATNLTHLRISLNAFRHNPLLV